LKIQCPGLLFLFFISCCPILKAQTIFPCCWVYDKTNIPFEIDTIDSLEYYHLRPLGFQIQLEDSTWWDENFKVREDSVNYRLKKDFPESFKFEDSCLTLLGTDTSVKVCHFPDKDASEQQNFWIRTFDRNFLEIICHGYESREFILFNPRTQILKSFYSAPVFINDSIVCAAGMLYGFAAFEVCKLTGSSYFGFEPYDDILECYSVNDRFYFQLHSTNRAPSKKNYLSVLVKGLY
jgi:hypothetical protein